VNFFSEIRLTFFAFAKKMIGSWWYNLIFCVGKVWIWMCQIILTFSGLHFFIFYDSLEFLSRTWLVKLPLDKKWPFSTSVHNLELTFWECISWNASFAPNTNVDMSRNTQTIIVDHSIWHNSLNGLKQSPFSDFHLGNWTLLKR
jgi:hypothetical protein